MRRCPKCRSSRVRRGYAHDPLIVRLVGFRELLCDSCNLRFRGFVIPGTLPHSNRNRKKEDKPTRQQATKEEAQQTSSKPGRTGTLDPEQDAKQCPRCESDMIHRSHRQGITERLASALSIYPYRCDNCNNRFLARRRISS
jgi:predicted Zn-ribbon and HTH transcriptional regulator